MKKRYVKSLLLVACVVACLGMGRLSGHALAYLTDSNGAINKIKIGGIETTTSEHFDPSDPFNVIKEVAIRNTGDSKCFVRVRISWSNEQLKKYATEYINTTDWEYVSSENFYYYKGILQPGATTPTLLQRITVGRDIPYDLQEEYSINVYQESISVDETAATDAKNAWKEKLGG